MGCNHCSRLRRRHEDATYRSMLCTPALDLRDCTLVSKRCGGCSTRLMLGQQFCATATSVLVRRHPGDTICGSLKLSQPQHPSCVYWILRLAQNRCACRTAARSIYRRGRLARAGGSVRRSALTSSPAHEPHGWSATVCDRCPR